MNDRNPHEFDLFEIEEKARQLRAEAIRHAVARMRGWVKSHLGGRSAGQSVGRSAGQSVGQSVGQRRAA